MKLSIPLLAVFLSSVAYGAGPVYYEPSAYTGDAIERAISDAFKDPRGRVFLPGGTYRINKTINLNGYGPIIIEGASLAMPYTEWNHQSSVKLEWRGPAGQPMIHMNSFGVQIKNVMLDGRDVAGYGILLTNSPHVGTGQNRLEDVNLCHFTSACFQAGEAKGDGNCSDSSFDRVMFLSAPSGFRSVNDQSVNNYFNGCQFGWLGVALDIDRGGAVSVIAGSAGFTDVLVRLAHSGHNAGPIHIGPFKVERSGYKNKYMSLVDAQPTRTLDWGMDSGQIRFVSLRMGDGVYPNIPDSVETPLFRLGPGTMVTCEGCFFKQEGDNGQWPLAYVQGKKNIGSAVLRSRDTIWNGDLNSIVSNNFGLVELNTPPSGYGDEKPTFSRQVAP